MNNIFRSLRENKSLVLVILIVFVFCALRIYAYGDVRLSIAGNDTQSYIDASQASIFSSEIMTGRRLLSTNLLYKIFEPKDGYEILVNGSIDTTRRVIQPSFIGIVVLQIALSLVSWGLLAVVVAYYLKNLTMKILSTIIIMLFAFSPQVADWDSILMSESLTFSLFIFNFAVLLHIGFILFKNPQAKFHGWVVTWAFGHFLWTFLRDTNLFASIPTIFAIVILFFFLKEYRANTQIRFVLFFNIFVTLLGLMTASQSHRSLVQLVNIYQSDILSSPLRVEIFKEMGMPEPKTSEYRTWFEENAQSSLVKFMLKHPGYPIIKILNDFPQAFMGTKQTYFKAPELGVRQVLMAIGDALHPQNFTSFFVGFLLLVGIVQLAYYKVGYSIPWAWGSLWLFLVASIMFIPSILGDTWALVRHSLLSTLSYKLCMWLFIIVVMDIALSKSAQIPQPVKITIS